MRSLLPLILSLFFLMGCQRQSGPFDFEILTTRGFINTSDWRGQNVIVFFGFTHCPHICPTVFRTMNRLKLDNLKIVFISVDHYRDNVKTMLNHPMIGEHIYAAGGTPEQLKMIAAQYGTDFEVKLNKDHEPFVNHSSHVFILDRSGQKLEIMDYDSTPEAFLTAIKHLEAKPLQKPENLSTKKILASNLDCDLAQGPCKIDYQGSSFTLEFNHLPVKDDAYQTLILTSSDEKFSPRLIDLVGLDFNMGLIRPSWKKETTAKYSASFRLPVCELPAMQWRARLLLSDQNNQESLLEYSFQTKRF
jgi:protein SCO1/2